MMEHHFLLLLSLGYSLIAITTADSSGICLAGWRNFRDSCYTLDKAHLTYDEGKVQCESRIPGKSGLATIIDAEEQEFVSTLGLRTITAWIGLRRETSGQLYWEDRSTYNYTNLEDYSRRCAFVKSRRRWDLTSCVDKKDILCKAPADSSGRCLAGWKNNGDFCYIRDARSFKYDEGKIQCESRIPGKSWLASILDADEQAFLFPNGAKVYNTWIGLTQSPSRKFNWEDGSTFNYTKWARDWTGCAILYSQSQWYISRCIDLFNSLCKAPTVCEEGRFGVDCTGVCHCCTGSCDSDTGACANTKCAPGWAEPPISQGDECPQGKFGDSCSETCNCHDGIPCHKVTGSCKWWYWWFRDDEDRGPLW